MSTNTGKRKPTCARSAWRPVNWQLELPHPKSANLHFLSCRQIVCGILSTLLQWIEVNSMRKFTNSMYIWLLIKVVTKLAVTGRFRGEGAKQRATWLLPKTDARQTACMAKQQHTNIYFVYLRKHTHTHMHGVRWLKASAGQFRAIAVLRTRLELHWPAVSVNECVYADTSNTILVCIYKYYMYGMKACVGVRACIAWKLIKKTNEVNANEWTHSACESVAPKGRFLQGLMCRGCVRSRKI